MNSNIHCREFGPYYHGGEYAILITMHIHKLFSLSIVCLNSHVYYNDQPDVAGCDVNLCIMNSGIYGKWTNEI